jgi:hypothetical protein
LPLTLPNLDDVTWEELNEEARSLIPSYAPTWTNYNPSDPGITLLEALAYFSEILLYRVDRISDAQTIKFLQLLNGPDWKPTRPLDEEKSAAIAILRRPVRAVTATDYEQLTLTVLADDGVASTKVDGVARAKCVPERNLESEDAEAYAAAAPGHVSVVVVSDHRRPPTQVLLRRVKHELQAARLLTTQVHVVAPRFVTFGVQVTLVLLHHASPQRVQNAALRRLENYFDPLTGGADGRGWPFGQHVYVSELYQLLDAVPGVDYVLRSKDATKGEENKELVVEEGEQDRLRFNSVGGLEAIEVHEEELVALRVAKDDLLVETKR